jgi:polyhydroxybutyrate depolymerase
VTIAILVAVVALTTGCDRDRGRVGDRRAAPADEQAAGTPPATATTAGCASEATTRPPAGQSNRTFAFGGTDRTYLLYVPASYDGTKPVPVVFEFHGFGSSAGQQIVYGDFRPLADREGFLLVVPDGQGTPRHFTYRAAGAESDDIAFAIALLDHVGKELCVDQRRVFSTGMSNGGALSSVLACRAPDRFAAVAPVAAFFFLPPCAEGGRPAPILAMMGVDDPIVPYAGGRVNCCGNPNIPGAEDTMASFAERSACTEPPIDDRPSPSIRHRHWEGCKDGNAVELYAVEGGGHTWPGAAVEVGRLGATTHELVATETIWSFFAAHPLPSR